MSARGETHYDIQGRTLFPVCETRGQVFRLREQKTNATTETRLHQAQTRSRF
jgi:hypothetical protein